MTKSTVQAALKRERANVLQSLFDYAMQANDNFLVNPEQSEQNELNIKIYKKYNRKKIIINKALLQKQKVAQKDIDEFEKKFPFGIEIWIHPDLKAKSKEEQERAQIPIIEDYALSRAESIFNAAQNMILSCRNKDNCEKELKKLYDEFKGKIINYLNYPPSKKQHKSIIKELEQFYNKVIATIVSRDSLKENPSIASIKEAVKWLAEQEQILTPDYAKKDILTLNQTNNSFEYYQRNYQATQEQIKADPEYVKGGRLPTLPSHHRVGELLPNYASFSFGTYEEILVDLAKPDIKFVTVKVEHSGARHGTLPPIDLYKNKNISPHKIAAITYRNAVQLLEQDLNKIRHVENSIDKPITFTHRYVHLISPGQPNEKQREQFLDTRRVAYALRDPGIKMNLNGHAVAIKMSYGCYGVNPFRSFRGVPFVGRVTNYQWQCANNIDFIDMYENTDSVQRYQVLAKLDPEGKNLKIAYHKALSKLTELSKQYFDSIKENKDDTELDAKAKAIDEQEKVVFKHSKQYKSLIFKMFNQNQMLIEEKINNFKPKATPTLQDQQDIQSMARLSCFHLIQKMQAAKRWAGSNFIFNSIRNWVTNKTSAFDDKRNGIMQTLMCLLTELNADFYSTGCKSGTDRAQLVLLELKKINEKLSCTKKIDENSLDEIANSLDEIYAASASHIQAKFDNRGMPSKFDGQGLAKVAVGKDYAALGNKSAHKQAEAAIGRNISSTRKAVVKHCQQLRNSQPTSGTTIMDKLNSTTVDVIKSPEQIRMSLFIEVSNYINEKQSTYKTAFEKLKEITADIEISTKSGLMKFMAYLLDQAASVKDRELKVFYNKALHKYAKHFDDPKAVLQLIKKKYMPPHNIRGYLHQLYEYNKNSDAETVSIDKIAEIIKNITVIWYAENMTTREDKINKTVKYLSEISSDANIQLPLELKNRASALAEAYKKIGNGAATNKVQGAEAERPASDYAMPAGRFY